MNEPEHIEVYRAEDGFRWRWQAGNGRIMADSGEAYTREGDAVLAAVHASVHDPPVRLEEEDAGD